jgi:hypothetical protein
MQARSCTGLAPPEILGTTASTDLDGLDGPLIFAPTTTATSTRR